jgi:hypothetical protein
MDEIKTDGWERISGAAECRDCRQNFTVSIAANEIGRSSEHYLGF